MREMAIWRTRANLCTDDNDISNDSVRHFTSTFSVREEIRGPHHDDPNDDDAHAEQPEPLQPLLEKNPGENTHKHHDGASQHLELRGAGEVEANVHHGGGRDVTQGRREEQKRVGLGLVLVLVRVRLQLASIAVNINQVDEYTQHLSQHHHIRLKILDIFLSVSRHENIPPGISDD